MSAVRTRATAAIAVATALLVLSSATGCASRSAAVPAAAPATTSDDALVATLLATSCTPCHATPRTDPWYARLAPSSWWTDGARRVLDLSDRSALDAAHRAAIAASVQAGTMPPADYTFFNRAAAFSDADRRAVVRWATAADAH